jgi:hypothetical protein
METTMPSRSPLAASPSFAPAGTCQLERSARVLANVGTARIAGHQWQNLAGLDMGLEYEGKPGDTGAGA